MTELLDGRYREVRNLVRENLAAHASVLDEAQELDTTAYRERVKELVLELAESGQTGYGFPTEYGGGGDVGASIAAFETSAFGDLSVLVKLGVQFGLFGGAILQLGTERHHREYLPRVISGELMGSFAMTETGHGSDVQSIGTTATYDQRPTSSSCAPPTTTPARTTSATPPCTRRPRSSSPSSSSTAPSTGCMPWSCRCATSR